MLKTDSILSDYIFKKEQSQYAATSLRKDCLQNLRFPNSSSQHPIPRTHLLACMSQFIQEQSDIKTDDVDDFCCFDRMKRIIQKRKNQDDQSRGNKQMANSQNEKLFKFVQIETKLRKMQQNLMKYTSDGTKNQKRVPNSQNKKNQTHQSQHNLFLTSPAVRRWQDEIVTSDKFKNKNQNLPGRFQMKKKIREQGYKQYVEWQKKKVQDNENNIKKFVQTEIQEKVNTMLQQRDIKFNQLLQQNKNLQRCLLQKNLQIQNLKSKQQYLTKNLRELEVIKDIISQQNTKAGRQKQIFLQSFHKQFCEIFPNENIRSLKQYIDTITDKCLYKFNDIQYKKVQQWKQQKSDMKQKMNRLENNLERFKINQNQLLNNIKQFRYEKSVATLEMDALLRKQSQLDRLQKKILSIYNDWYGKLSQSEKQLMKNMGYLRSNYQYEEMLDYIVVYQKKFSTDPKVNDYLIKILRGVQRIRKILFPKTHSSQERQQIMDPLFILDKLQKYVKSKVYQIQKKFSSNLKGTRTSHIIQQQFLQIQSQDKIVENEAEILIKNDGEKKSVLNKSKSNHKSEAFSIKNSKFK